MLLQQQLSVLMPKLIFFIVYIIWLHLQLTPIHMQNLSEKEKIWFRVHCKNSTNHLLTMKLSKTDVQGKFINCESPTGNISMVYAVMNPLSQMPDTTCVNGFFLKKWLHLHDNGRWLQSTKEEGGALRGDRRHTGAHGQMHWAHWLSPRKAEALLERTYWNWGGGQEIRTDLGIITRRMDFILYRTGAPGGFETTGWRGAD